MKAPDFAYVRPQRIEDALELLERHAGEAVPLAGGQSLLPALNMRLSKPALLVDIGALGGLGSIALDGDTVAIGALVRHVELLRSDLVARRLPLVAEAARHVGHVAIRNRGTIGGSLANADPAAELPACLVALDATLVLASRRGRRSVAARAFFKGLFETDLAPGELIVEARVPAQDAARRWGFAELSRRHGDFAVAGLAALATIEGDRIAQAELVYFGCSDRPRRAPGAARALAGRTLPLAPPDGLAEALRQDLAVESAPGFKEATKLHLAAVLTRRVLDSMRTRG